jgi:phosphohistidine phosphatase SixA
VGQGLFLRDGIMISIASPLPSRRQAITLMAAAVASPLTQAQAVDPVALLRAGACVVLLRHAVTEPGVGDPPEFQLEVCRTQRNLSEAGQQDARRIGTWFKRSQLQPRAVLSSAWCRCKDTAQLAFGQHNVWSALNSTFADRLAQPDQSGVLRQAMGRIPNGQFEVWVTHQVNITALTQLGPSMGEAIIADRQGRVLMRTSFA